MSMWSQYRASAAHEEGKEWLGLGKRAGTGFLGLGKGSAIFNRALMAGSAILGAYTGYQEEGVWGAAKGIATNYALGVAWNVAKTAVGALGSVAYAAIPIAAGAAYINRKLLTRPLVREHMVKHAKLEMGRPIVDQFGSIATMRQRSVMAIQNSKINGRSALGNEAFLFSSKNYYR